MAKRVVQALLKDSKVSFHRDATGVVSLVGGSHGGGYSSVLDANYTPPPQLTVGWTPLWGGGGRGGRVLGGGVEEGYNLI